MQRPRKSREIDKKIAIVRQTKCKQHYIVEFLTLPLLVADLAAAFLQLIKKKRQVSVLNNKISHYIMRPFCVAGSALISPKASQKRPGATIVQETY